MWSGVSLYNWKQHKLSSRMTRAFNKTSEKEKRRQLRNNMPPAEVLLWGKLKGKALSGYKFRRQFSVNKFVLDFYCPELKLAIELDGDSHFDPGKDEERQRMIESYGIRFLRFTNEEVYKNLEEVLLRILSFNE